MSEEEIEIAARKLKDYALKYSPGAYVGIGNSILHLYLEARPYYGSWVPSEFGGFPVQTHVVGKVVASPAE